MKLVENVTDRPVPSVLYHVAGRGYKVGQPLTSLYSRHGTAAYDKFNRRWPESGGLGEYHAHYVMFYDNLADARAHARSGKVLAIDPTKLDDLRFDQLEQPGFFVSASDVPADAITVV
jgi:hypothetical protein